MAIGEGIISGIGRGTASYIDARFRGRGETTAAIKRDKRMARYESNENYMRRKQDNEIAKEYYRTALEEGDNPYKGPRGSINRAKYLSDVKARRKEDEYAANVRKTRDTHYAANAAKLSSERDANREVTVYDPRTNSLSVMNKMDMEIHNMTASKKRKKGRS